MENAQTEKILQLALRAGGLLMKNGAEVYRVEETIERICQSCGMAETQVVATPTAIHVSVVTDEENQKIVTQVARIHGSTTNLRRICEINQFSRTFTTQGMTVEEGNAELDRIDKEKPYPVWLRVIGASVTACAFGMIYSESISSAICSLVIGAITILLEAFLDRYDINYFIKDLSCCAVASALSLAAFTLALTPEFSSTVIGAVMLFVPGAAITNSIRDLLTGDTLSGLARLTEAFLIAIALAAGAGIVIKLWSIASLEISTAATATEMNVLLLWALGMIASAGFCILFTVPANCIFYAALGGGLGWLANRFVMAFAGQSAVVSVFLGACVVGALSILFSKVAKAPMTTFIIPGIMPLVPGSGMYYTMYYLTTGQLDTGSALAIQTLLTAGAIALGLLVTGSIFMICVTIHRKIMAS